MAIIKIVPMPGPSGEGGTGGDLVVPVNIKDSQGNDFISFERTGTNTARIETPQDDLSLRSARDITLFAGTEGPGNVYIGWGDATYTPDSPNRVATIGDINTAPKTWTAPNDIQYSIHQTHGGIQVETSQSSTLTDEVSSLGNYINQTSINLIVGETTNQLLSSIVSGETNLREITITDGINFTKFLRNPFLQGGGPVVGTYIWNFTCDLSLILSENTGYGLTIQYGGPPVLWWNADDLGIAQNLNDFRGAKIDYHAYVTDAGTMIGTIYIAHDTSDFYITHIETSSGGSDLGTVNLWYRKTNTYEDDRKIYLYRTDGEAVIHKIQWTAQVYYANELWD